MKLRLYQVVVEICAKQADGLVMEVASWKGFLRFIIVKSDLV